MSTGQGVAAVLCSWEGSRRSGISLAMHHRLCGISTYGLNGLKKGDEHPAYAALASIAQFIFACRFLVPVSMIICNDIMAYMFGFFFGRTPLIKLSPKKTWEGFIGGAISTVVFGVLVSVTSHCTWLQAALTV